MPVDSSDVTALLARIRAKDRGARNQLVAELYDQFRQRARGRMRGERGGHSFQSTDLAHEALMRILTGPELSLAENRNQLFRAFARAMRQTLVDHARRRNAIKRGGRCVREELEDFAADVRRRAGGDTEALHEALAHLASSMSREASVLEMKFFGGFTLTEIAAAHEVSLTTVERDSRFGLAWLRTHLAQENAHGRSYTA